MACPHCTSPATTERRQRTSLGYRTFRCRACRRVFNERTGTPFNHLQYPTDLVLLVVLWRLRYKALSKRRCYQGQWNRTKVWRPEKRVTTRFLLR